MSEEHTCNMYEIGVVKNEKEFPRKSIETINVTIFYENPLMWENCTKA